MNKIRGFFRFYNWPELLIAIVLFLGCLSCAKNQADKANHREAANRMNRPVSKTDSMNLHFEIICDTTYRAGHPVEIEFVLRNISDDTLYVLEWYTPFEGILGRIFTITRDGDTLEYQGPMVKRMPPTESDYFGMAPGSTRSAIVDLGRAYDLSKPGNYTLDFRGELDDVVKSKAAIAENGRTHSSIKAKGQPAQFVIVSD